MPSQRSSEKAQIGAYVVSEFKDVMVAAAARKGITTTELMVLYIGRGLLQDFGRDRAIVSVVEQTLKQLPPGATAPVTAARPC